MNFSSILNRLNTPLYRFWLTVNIIMGLFYSLVVPPFQSPDEWHHFFKINHIIEGNFYGEVDTATVSLGGTIPKSVAQIAEPYIRMRWDATKKTDLDTFRYIFTIPLNRSEKTFEAFPNTARYAPLAYAPQVVSIGLTRLFDLKPTYTTYVGRIANYAFWLLCITLVFLITPIFKDLFLYITLIPATASFQATLSADVFSNGCLFLMMALFFRFKFGKAPLSNRELWAFWGLSFVSTWAKIVYFPMLFLFLLVPKERFSAPNQKWRQLAMGLAVNFAIMFWWNNAVTQMIYPFGDVNRTTYHNLHLNDAQTDFVIVNPKLQVERIKHDPIRFVGQFLRASTELYSYCNTTYVSSVGWEILRVPQWLHISILVFLGLILATEYSPISFKEKWFLAVLAHSLSCMFLLSQHLHWDEIGESMIVHYIGKYYIVIFPLFFFALTGWLFKYKTHFEKLNLGLILRGLFLIAYGFMIHTTLTRFYDF